MSKYPIYLDLEETQAVVVGAGSVAGRKVKTLLEAGARVRIVTKEVAADFERLCKGLDFELLKTAYSKSHLADAFLVIAATDDSELNTQIYNDCKELKILCNVVDVPELCNFYVPSVIQQGDIQIAIGTNGKCPAYAAQLRRTFEKLITADHAAFLDCLDIIRQDIIASGISLANRKTLLVQLANDESFEAFQNEGKEIWLDRARQMLSAQKENLI